MICPTLCSLLEMQFLHPQISYSFISKFFLRIVPYVFLLLYPIIYNFACELQPIFFREPEKMHCFNQFTFLKGETNIDQ